MPRYGAPSTLPPMRLPPALGPGARVALVAPAGPLRSPDELDTALANARSLGWEPVPSTQALARAGYLAGDDTLRATALNDAFRDDSIDAIWCLRGGYGAMRLLPALDYDALTRRPKALIGYSDITALHAAIGTRCDLVSYHGPTARGTLTDFSRDSLVHAVIDARDPCGAVPDARTIRPGRASGRLVGGNLALLASLVGTPYAPDYRGAILFLEDIGETTYRIDRMLTQLRLSGALGSVAGIVYGQFTEGSDPTDVTSRRLDDVLQEAAAAAGVPAIAGAPIGHIDDQWTMPVGAMAELDADARSVHVFPNGPTNA
jgi:muramoyltetrapeptide carboxypeptidase